MNEKPKIKFYKYWWFWVLIIVLGYLAIGLVVGGVRYFKTGYFTKPTILERIMDDKAQNIK